MGAGPEAGKWHSWKMGVWEAKGREGFKKEKEEHCPMPQIGQIGEA